MKKNGDSLVRLVIGRVMLSIVGTIDGSNVLGLKIRAKKRIVLDRKTVFLLLFWFYLNQREKT